MPRDPDSVEARLDRAAAMFSRMMDEATEQPVKTIGHLTITKRTTGWYAVRGIEPLRCFRTLTAAEEHVSRVDPLMRRLHAKQGKECPVCDAYEEDANA